MQAQLLIAFLAQALLIAGAHAQESLDASCNRYAAGLGIYASCDGREFFEPAAPGSDIGLEAALAQRLNSVESILSASTGTLPREEDPLTGAQSADASAVVGRLLGD